MTSISDLSSFCYHSASLHQRDRHTSAPDASQETCDNKVDVVSCVCTGAVVHMYYSTHVVIRFAFSTTERLVCTWKMDSVFLIVGLVNGLFVYVNVKTEKKYVRRTAPWHDHHVSAIWTRPSSGWWLRHEVRFFWCPMYVLFCWHHLQYLLYDRYLNSWEKNCIGYNFSWIFVFLRQHR